jgi:hypothetical protein
MNTTALVDEVRKHYDEKEEVLEHIPDEVLMGMYSISCKQV